MSDWKKVKIGDFLHQYRNTIYVEDSEIYRQITISSKVGIKYRCSKIGKEIGRKRQFKIDLKNNPNTVIFTRQGLHEGSIGIAPQEVDGCIVTENMPMFSIDESIVLSAYLKLLFKSSLFTELIGILTPTGSAQKSIHERDLLPLEISIPDLSTQKAIVENLSHQLMKNEDLLQEMEKQKSYVKQLRQNILQDAIEGKLTEEWRKNNPVVKGNPDFDVEALFEKIQEEKCHTDSELLRNSKKKEKALPEITEDEKPFEIPEGWKWVRLGEIVNSITDGDHLPPPKQATGIPFVVISDISSGVINFKGDRFVSEDYFTKLPLEKIPLQNDILYTVTGSYGIPVFVTDFQFCVQRHIGIIKPKLYLKDFIYYCLKSPVCKKQADFVAWGVAVKTVPIKELRKFIIPLSPLAEQTEIVRVVESQLAKVDQLEKQITEREEMTKQLIQSIMKDAFREG